MVLWGDLLGHPWIPGFNEKDRRLMLKRIGVSDWHELYRDVPTQLILPEPPRVGFGKPLSEWELRLVFERYLARNKVFIDPPPFMGGGVCFHTIPSTVKAIISRSEFYTAYTPYQPEINQGLLQTLFEYQSLMAELTGMDVVNASMYDMSTAVAEAALMAMRVTRRRKIIIPSTMNPQHYEVLKTWLLGKDAVIAIVDRDEETYGVSLDSLEKLIDKDTAAVYIEQPSFLGFIESNVETIADIAHKHGALFIVGIDPLSLGLLKPPGEYGADIVVGEGQPLGLGLNYGGPYLGIFGVRWDRKLVRQMPGRLIGATETIDGSETGFMMILQTREQHIKREKATSNITTNEALMAVAAAVYMSLLGSNGLRELAKTIWVKSHYLARRLSELDGVKAPIYNAEFFKELAVRFPIDYLAIHEYLLRKGILGGLYLRKFFSDIGEAALFCVTEAHSRRHIDELVNVIGEALSERGENRV